MRRRALYLMVFLFVIPLLLLLLFSFVPAAFSQTVGVTRTLDKDVVEPGGKVRVKIDFDISRDVGGIIVGEEPPAGFSIAESKPAVMRLDKDTNRHLWVFTRLAWYVWNETIIYTISIPENATEGTYTLKGDWSAIGRGLRLNGSIPEASFTIEKVKSSISISVSPQRIIEEERVEVRGSLAPSRGGETLTLTLVKPDGSPFTRRTVTSDDGSFLLTFTPDTLGAWSVKARWEGDNVYKGSESVSVTFEVVAAFNVGIIAVAVAVVAAVAGAALVLMKRRSRQGAR